MKTQIILILSLLLVGELSLAQVLTRPFNISKSAQQMQSESVSARNFFKSVTEEAAPRRLDLLQYQTPIRNQGQRGTCVAFASMAFLESQLKVQTGRDSDLSEQYSYWASKAIDQIAPHQDGSIPLDFMKSLEKNGVPAEAAWPYESVGWFDDAKNHPDCKKVVLNNPDRLPTVCLTNGNAPAQAINAEKVRVVQAHRVPSAPEAIMGFLQAKVAVVIGADVYEKAWSYSEKTSPGYLTGKITMPGPGDKLIGGHAFLIVGYDMDQKVFLFKNSWGTDKWASKATVPGYGTIPFDYIRKYGDALVAKLPARPN